MATAHVERRTPTIRLFLMVIAAVTWFAVMLPIGARAAGQLVTLVDPTTDSKARVDSGKLRVGDGSGALTVNGSVATTPQVPATGFNGFLDRDANRHLGTPDQAGTNYLITTMIVTNGDTNRQTAVLVAYYGVTKDCIDFTGDVHVYGPSVMVPPGESVVVNFSQPWAIRAPALSGKGCLFSSSVSSSVRVQVVGYKTQGG
jgi:hypothetical protein